MSPNASGDTIILVRDATDKQRLATPKGATLEWVIEADLGAEPSLLTQAARKLSDIDAFTYAWVACEFEAMKHLRDFLRNEKSLGKDKLYISSYWKRGLVEDDHKQVKRADTGAGA